MDMRFMPGETLLGRLIAICVSAITATYTSGAPGTGGWKMAPRS